jgi:hypothetical protein
MDSAMARDDVINNLIRIPRMLCHQPDMSLDSLLEQSGYLGTHDEISESAIRGALTQNPDCIPDWSLLSENKRTSAGWFFIEEETDRYIVGYIDPVAGQVEKREYSDASEACAAFIKREVEHVRRSLLKRHR